MPNILFSLINPDLFPFESRLAQAEYAAAMRDVERERAKEKLDELYSDDPLPDACGSGEKDWYEYHMSDCV